MNRKRKIIKLDGDKNADWIKALPGHKNEVAIHEALAKKKRRKKKPKTRKEQT